MLERLQREAERLAQDAAMGRTGYVVLGGGQKCGKHTVLHEAQRLAAGEGVECVYLRSADVPSPERFWTDFLAQFRASTGHADGHSAFDGVRITDEGATNEYAVMENHSLADVWRELAASGRHTASAKANVSHAGCVAVGAAARPAAGQPATFRAYGAGSLQLLPFADLPWAKRRKTGGCVVFARDAARPPPATSKAWGVAQLAAMEALVAGAVGRWDPAARRGFLAVDSVQMFSLSEDRRNSVHAVLQKLAECCLVVAISHPLPPAACRKARTLNLRCLSNGEKESEALLRFSPADAARPAVARLIARYTDPWATVPAIANIVKEALPALRELEDRDNLKSTDESYWHFVDHLIPPVQFSVDNMEPREAFITLAVFLCKVRSRELQKLEDGNQKGAMTNNASKKRLAKKIQSAKQADAAPNNQVPVHRLLYQVQSLLVSYADRQKETGFGPHWWDPQTDFVKMGVELDHVLAALKFSDDADVIKTTSVSPELARAIAVAYRVPTPDQGGYAALFKHTRSAAT
ncbi:hypothetical protein DIPPA_21303 [Diplonema papillatum]|nr:hypothetical protein DIPPA_21303 [Diplonema papillatum]